MAVKARKPVIGWREWVSLPGMGLHAIKAKVDTGARTSSLHACKIQSYREKGAEMVRFTVQPVQRRKDIAITYIAEISDRRHVTDSGGHREKRIVIATPIRLAGREWEIEMTLTNREDMMFRMLIGRTAMRSHVIIDPSKSFLHGQLSHEDVCKIYEEED